jgi:hypothetical protein
MKDEHVTHYERYHGRGAQQNKGAPASTAYMALTRRFPRITNGTYSLSENRARLKPHISTSFLVVYPRHNEDRNLTVYGDKHDLSSKTKKSEHTDK